MLTLVLFIVCKLDPPFYFQNHAGRIVQTRWVVGMVSLQFQPPRPIFHVVQSRDRVTLHGLITTYVLPGTTIRTDMWRGYDGLNAIGYVHQTVNHTRNFVNPVTGKSLHMYRYENVTRKHQLLSTNILECLIF